MTSPADQGPSIDATAMKAFAHPLRMKMHSMLTDRGPATATMLAARLGESTGQTSYHLRQLAKHGFIEEDTSQGKGRERWWKSLGFTMRGREMASDPATRPALELMLRTQRQQRAEAVRDWLARVPSEPKEWVDASLDNTSTARMTATQMREFSTALTRLIQEHSERAKQENRNTDAPTRVVRSYLDVFPLPTDDDTAPSGSAESS